MINMYQELSGIHKNPPCLISAGSFCTCHANLWPQHDGELSSPQEDMEGLQPILLETEMYELQQDMET